MDVLDIEERRETNTLKQIEWREGGIEINTTYIYIYIETYIETGLKEE